MGTAIDNLTTSPTGPSLAALPAVLDENGLFDLLRMESDAEWLAYLVQRRGLPAITFKRDGRTYRRFVTASVLRWMDEESTKRSTNGDEKDGDRSLLQT